MRVADRMKLLKPSGTLVMAEKASEVAKTGRKVLHLEIGEPDFATPDYINEAAYKAIKNGFTHYTSSRGILELREAIANDLKRIQVEADPNEEIIVTSGSKHGIYCACLATLNPGDEVLVLSPTWPSHFTCIESAQAKPVEVPCGDAFRLNEEALKERITSQSRMILLCSPNNPTGGVLSEEELRVISDIAEDHDLLILSDEIYNKIVYDGFKIRSMASFENVRDRVILVNGFSKSYAMTGWRLGYVFAAKIIIDVINKIIQSTTTCPASFVQKAGAAALRGHQECVTKMVEKYDCRRKFIVERLNEIPGIHCEMPKGAFYVFPDFSSLGMPSMDVAVKLLDEKGVCSTPGSVFGRYGEGHIRFSYANSYNIIAEAMEKTREFVLQHS
ncbi:MAG: pyridoxal phosphate-dependent aminotransferase [Candidatus Bathyarchaeia archaeon]